MFGVAAARGVAVDDRDREAAFAQVGSEPVLAVIGAGEQEEHAFGGGRCPGVNVCLNPGMGVPGIPEAMTRSIAGSVFPNEKPPSLKERAGRSRTRSPLPEPSAP